MLPMREDIEMLEQRNCILSSTIILPEKWTIATSVAFKLRPGIRRDCEGLKTPPALNKLSNWPPSCILYYENSLVNSRMHMNAELCRAGDFMRGFSTITLLGTFN